MNELAAAGTFAVPTEPADISLDKLAALIDVFDREALQERDRFRAILRADESSPAEKLAAALALLPQPAPVVVVKHLEPMQWVADFENGKIFMGQALFAKLLSSANEWKLA